jgi:hypothetical protein
MSSDLVGCTDRSMWRRFGPLALSACLLAGCSNPPTKEHDQAVAALAAARTAEAAAYAPDELQAAEAALGKYADAVAQGDYRQALSDAIDARDRAFEAARQAATQKAAARSQLQQAIADLDTALKAATARLAPGSGAHLTAPSAERLRNAVRDATPALQEARAAFDQEKFRDGLGRLQPIADELRKASAPVETGRRGRGGHSEP